MYSTNYKIRRSSHQIIVCKLLHHKLTKQSSNYIYIYIRLEREVEYPAAFLSTGSESIEGAKEEDSGSVAMDRHFDLN